MKKTILPFAPTSLQAIPMGGLLVVLALSAQAEQADPFSTGKQVAPSPAGSMLHAPCGDEAAAAPLTLAGVVERALCNNPQTREAWANARAQAAQVGVSESAYLPSVSLSGGDSRNRTSGVESHNLLSATASLSYVLYDFGARAASLESAQQILAAANATQDATIQSVFLAAVQAYYQLFAAQAAVDSAREAEKSAQESVTAASARYKVGAATPADSLQAQTALSQAVLNRIRAEGEFANSQGALANSMGLDANHLPALAAPAASTPDARFAQGIEQLIAEARRLRPDLSAAAAQVKAARAGEDAARAAGMPTIALASNFNHTDSSLADSTSSAALGVSVTVPLFTGYGNTYRIRAAQELTATRRAQHERLNRQIALEVWKAYQGVTTETQAVKSSADLLASASQSERVALGRYKAGVGNLLDLLAAQSALASARVQNIQALYNWRLARATLAQSIGRLDFSAIETPASQPTIP